MKQQRFWEVDLRVVLRSWWNDIAVFAMTAVTFVFLALPVIIPALIMWFLMSVNFTVNGGMSLPP
ncbi:MAG: hypothetical protein JWQ88_2718 [Rhodoferax sp.]|nr:hypothetical protein [Rhodoferax sp.]